MNYQELFQFEPIEAAVRLSQAEDSAGAKTLVQTCTLSPELAERIAGTVIPHLRLEGTEAPKGLLFSSHFGLGKSHLMAALSAVAEHADLASLFTHTATAQALEAIAGRFKVLRVEVGASAKDLRKLVCARLERGLGQWGVPYTFPAPGKAGPIEASLETMMAAFQERFPGQGLLLALDDLVEHWRDCADAPLLQDLEFLGAIGRVCQRTRLRFMADAQEGLLHRPGLALAEEKLRQVKDRFEPVTLTARDARFVVAERLVRKSAGQKTRLEEYLAGFRQSHPALNERLPEWMDTFPIPPACLETLGKMPWLAPRRLLPMLSAAVRKVLAEPIPEDRPGLVPLETFWHELESNPELQSVPEVETVLQAGRGLEQKVRQSLPAEQRPRALQLVRALGVLRLATDDIYSPAGVTPAELGALLCLPAPDEATTAEAGAPDRLTALLEEIRRLDGGQWLERDAEKNQYGFYLKQFRRFVKPELVLHWVNAVPFVMLILTGAVMVAARFLPVAQKWFALAVLTHKVFAFSWLFSLPLVVLLRPRAHWQHLRVMLRWGPEDLVWLVQTVRSFYRKHAAMAPVGRFNTGQKINACLVMLYFTGFGASGLLMYFAGASLFPWYVHTALFFAALGSVGGHLYLSLFNPSTRISLPGIFHGWAPLEYVEHHHPLSLPPSRQSQVEPVSPKTVMEELFVSKVELVMLAAMLLLAVAGVFAFNLGQLTAAKQKFARSFADCISPKQLSTKHRLGPAAESCTKCHTYTGGIPDVNCEQCHAEIKDRRTRQFGYHGTLEGACVKCHKEHPDDNRVVVPLVREKFNHDQAAYQLQAKHAQVACDECHLKKRTRDMKGVYYLGLKYGACADCHKDPHEQQFVAACEKCHTAKGWTGAEVTFVHNADSAYRLEAKHESVACAKCHKPKTAGAALATAKFKGLGVECGSCHEDPHRRQFAAKCDTCHTAKGWEKELLTFDHDKDSQFHLEGKHAREKCAKCHTPSVPGEKLALAVFKGLKSGCVDCHKDPHRGQFEGACTKCHSAKGWKKEHVTFDHSKDSKYPLVGKHAEVKCAECHKPSAPREKLGHAPFRGLKTECADCHKDPHRAQFPGACARCHPDPAGWKGPHLKFEHDWDARYVLTGRHATVECVKCHQPLTAGGKLADGVFKGLATACEECHKVNHPETYGVLCLSCHTTATAWPKTRSGVDHFQKFEYEGERLSGKHLLVECHACHAAGKVSILGQTQPTGNPCLACHKENDAHKGALGNDCAKCHTNDGWKAPYLRFDHNTMTSYLLDKNHVNVACAKCHVDNQWKPLDATCKRCHPNKF